MLLSICLQDFHLFSRHFKSSLISQALFSLQLPSSSEHRSHPFTERFSMLSVSGPSNPNKLFTGLCKGSRVIIAAFQSSCFFPARSERNKCRVLRARRVTSALEKTRNTVIERELQHREHDGCKAPWDSGALWGSPVCPSWGRGVLWLR